MVPSFTSFWSSSIFICPTLLSTMRTCIFRNLTKLSHNFSNKIGSHGCHVLMELIINIAHKLLQFFSHLVLLLFHCFKISSEFPSKIISQCIELEMSDRLVEMLIAINNIPIFATCHD